MILRSRYVYWDTPRCIIFTCNFKNFFQRLEAHILSQARGLPFTGEEPQFTPEETDEISFQYNCIYEHRTAAFNYTTYDIQRDQDTINTGSTRCTVMIQSYEDPLETEADPHPFWYARVLGIFHAMVYIRGSLKLQRFKFLMVRWFGQEQDWLGGARHLRLNCIGYVEENDPEVFGFLDPSEVLRACHLIPTFSAGKTRSLLGPSVAQDSPEGDWAAYYVMRWDPLLEFELKYCSLKPRFVDWDMMMQYLGLGVGHMNSASFPGEADAIRVSPELNYIPPSQWENTDQEACQPSPSNVEVELGDPELEDADDAEEMPDEEAEDDWAEEMDDDDDDIDDGDDDFNENSYEF